MSIVEKTGWPRLQIFVRFRLWHHRFIDGERLATGVAARGLQVLHMGQDDKNSKIASISLITVPNSIMLLYSSIRAAPIVNANATFTIRQDKQAIFAHPWFSFRALENTAAGR